MDYITLFCLYTGNKPMLSNCQWDPQEHSSGRSEGKWYLQTYNISLILLDNQIVDHSDVVGASPVGPAPTIPSFST